MSHPARKYRGSTMQLSVPRFARSARGTILGLVLLAPAGTAAQAPAAVPSLHGSVSAGFAIGTHGYRLGTLEIAGDVEPAGLLSARLLVGSRPRMLCSSEDLDPRCAERAGFAALLGGIQFAPSRNTAQPYLGGQVGLYGYNGPVSASGGLMAAAQVGLRLRLGSLGGAYGDASYLMTRVGGFPIAGMGLYLSIPGLFEGR
jgi:hypothetical protein